MKGTLQVQTSKSSNSLDRKNPLTSHRQNLLKLLHGYFGYTEFRGRQLEAIETVLSGKDCFCLMPTGGGKSLCYQIPALAKNGVVLVVSPLIALMENQVAALKSHRIAAEFLSSTQKASVKAKIYEDLDSGKPSLRLLYVTPELIATSSFQSKLKKLSDRSLLSLIAIDEAHCISSWGHDFRPSYRQLSKLRSCFQDVPILALTATAAKKVREDIVKSLNLHQPVILLSSFNRPNVFYEVRYKDLLEDTYEDLRNLIQSDLGACVIIYCHARNTCDDVGARLRADGIVCRVYHAGLPDKARSQALEDWASGKVQVIVGTVAFGMGIDRKDVRLVCHFNMPKTIEGFYQESGRAGRDNKASRSVLYYGLDDKRSMEFILQNSPKGAKTKGKDSDIMLRKGIQDFEEVVAYCEKAGCRRQKLLSHFGEQVSSGLCSRTCDSCKYPSQLADKLQQLREAASSRGRYGFNVLIKKNDEGSKGFTSEFWNYSDEEANREDNISSSDSEAEKITNEVLRKQKSIEGLDSRINRLLAAERDYESRTKSEKSKDTDKKIITPSMRDMAKQKLTKSVDQAFQRHQATSLHVNLIVETLEMECFKKYGKSGRSFYNSQVASVIRWLSTCSPSDLNTKVPSEASKIASVPSQNSKIDDVESTYKQSEASKVEETKTTNANNRSAFPTVTCSDCGDDDKGKLNNVLNSKEAHSVTLERKRHSTGDTETKDSSGKHSLPPVPSFSSFMRKKHKSK